MCVRVLVLVQTLFAVRVHVCLLARVRVVVFAFRRSCCHLIVVVCWLH